MKITIRIIILCALLFALTAGISADKIYLKGQNQALDVQITKDSWEKVIYVFEGTPMEAPWERVEKVEYSGIRGTHFERAEKFYNVNNFHKAAGEYVKAARSSEKLGDWVISYAGYKGGMSFYKLGEYEKATKMFRYSLKTPDSHFEPDAYIMLGKCYRKLDDFEKAKEWLNKVTKKYGEEKYAQAQFLILETLFQAGKYREVLPQLKTQAGDLPKDSPVKIKIEIRIGLCHINLGDFNRGREVISEVISRIVDLKNRRTISGNSADDLLAQAYTAKGDSYFREKKYEKALRAYLHSAVTYSYVRNKAVAKGYYGAARSMFEVLKTANDPDIREKMIQKTKELFSGAKRLYIGNASVIRKINQYLKDLPSQ